jgi:hypothetical protein
MNQVTFHSLTMRPGVRSLTDDQEYNKISSPFVNELNLMPIELELIKSMFNKYASFDSLCNHSLNRPFARDYAYLEVSSPVFIIIYRILSLTLRMSRGSMPTLISRA